MTPYAVRIATLGIAFVAGSAHANVPAWGDKMRAMLAKQEATATQAAPAPAAGAVMLTIGADGSLIAIAPAPVAERAAVVSTSTTVTAKH